MTVAKDRVALAIKIADRIDNTRTLHVYPRAKREWKLEENLYLISEARQAGLGGLADQLFALTSAKVEEHEARRLNHLLS